MISLHDAEKAMRAASSNVDCDPHLFNADRPLFVLPNGRVILEKMNETLAPIATQFLVAIAEPVSRPSLFHEYQITSYSLFAAASAGIYSDEIVRVLQIMCKHPLPLTVVVFIQQVASMYGRLRLVMEGKRAFLETETDGLLTELLAKSEIIRCSRVADSARNRQNFNSDTVTYIEIDPRNIGDIKQQAMRLGVPVVEESQVWTGSSTSTRKENEVLWLIERNTQMSGTVQIVREGTTAFLDTQDDSSLLSELVAKSKTIRASRIDGTTKRQRRTSNHPISSVEIDPDKIEDVKQQAMLLGFRVLSAKKDTDEVPRLQISLKFLDLRPYQKEALARMFSHSRARSGVIVLPCGAGKTLVGISATCTIQRNTLVMCSNTMACKQWITQFARYSEIKNPSECILEFTQGKDCVFPQPQKDGTPAQGVVLFTTYAMMCIGDDKRSELSLSVIKKIRNQIWGLLILDEVHMAPADSFRKTIYQVQAQCKMGLTATLVREDDLITDLNFLVGPKIFEADATDLTEQGYLARVICSEVRCPMSAVFCTEYLLEKSEPKKQLYAAMNPNKFAACEKLMRFHEDNGDKILIFSDSVLCVESFAVQLKRHFMYGQTSEEERDELLARFRLSPGQRYNKKEAISTLILSRIGDIAIDLPMANVLIQVSSHFGSRRQEAQRLGRILRPKPLIEGDRSKPLPAIFYSLVSLDTKDMTYNTDRRQYLVDQGYAYRAIQWKDLMEVLGDMDDIHGEGEQQRLLDGIKLMKIRPEHLL